MARQTGLAVILLAAALSLTACGRKGALEAPGTDAKAPPSETTDDKKTNPEIERVLGKP